MAEPKFTEFYEARRGRPEVRFCTKLTREGKLDPLNRKPFRSADMKAKAKKQAIRDEWGSFYAPVPTLTHGKFCEAHRCTCDGRRPAQRDRADEAA